MSSDTMRVLLTYGIAAIVLVASFILIYQGRGDQPQAWLVIGTMMGYIFRDTAGRQAVSDVERISAAQPTVRVDPPQTIVTPTQPRDNA
jgi:hypothetical protein